MVESPGAVALFGSGEISPNGRRVYEWLFNRMASSIRVAVLETPAGFQPNSALVAEKVADFLREHLQNYRPQVTVVPARQRGTPFSPDDPRILVPLLTAGALFLGPGSPTYAARQLADSLAWRYLLARHRLGATLILASAATIAAGAHVLPVYEIYKAGADLHWAPGLDLLAPYGLSLTFVPHWNNTEGGAELDTSRCYMGIDRFERLLELLPPDQTVVGIDEHTALVLDPEGGRCHAMGVGGVTILHGREEIHFASGQDFPIDVLGQLRMPDRLEGVPAEVWSAVADARDVQAEENVLEAPPAEVLELVRARDAARSRRDWATADELRARIGAMGWQVADTREGPVLQPAEQDRAS